MSDDKIPLILPIETQVRELHGKLLLACVAAERGHDVYIGAQNEIRSRISTIPPGAYVAKGFASNKARFLTILHRLGFTVLAWDEEGLVHYPPKMYYQRRMSAGSLALIDGLFSWGSDYTALVRGAPFRPEIPIFEVGNPRLDLLRADVRKFYDDEVSALRRRFGRYILLNSNFGHQNSLVPRKRDEFGTVNPDDPEAEREWQAQLQFRTDLLKHFRTMVSRVASSFPDMTVVLRPHPAEKIETWREMESAHPNLKVLFEGSVLPWLAGAEVLIHNGCTTAIESILLDRPAISFEPISSDKYDRALPNSLSYRTHSIDDLLALTRGFVSSPDRQIVTPDQRRALDYYVASTPDRLDSDKIVDILQEHAKAWRTARPSKVLHRVRGKLDAALRAIRKYARRFRSHDIYSTWHQDKQFPPLEADDINRLIARFAEVTGRFQFLDAREHSRNLFRIVNVPKA
ncbi:MAG: surface carbohydrate biosynthesis protein [Parvibaculaceae bacterium]